MTKADTVSLHCRIPRHIDAKLRQKSGEKHALGVYVTEALSRFLDEIPGVSADVVADAIIRRIKDRF